ncbi:caspase family protein [Acidobacterium sp. S8]|uniref:caspase family protein n=1 Tax=Acidobacterium sp. S8 TaxID=1641854 RepID=UPI0020B10C38|nr:caspase family protein [Acidobacterium sp. S8]
MRRQFLSLTGFALAVFLVACLVRLPSFHAAESDSARPGRAAEAAPDNTPKKYALLVGINDYEHPESVSPLAGSVNDVENMRQVLIGKFEFPPENILVLTNAQATHAAILGAIKTHLIDKAQPGDIVVFDISSHGSQMKDVSGTKISGMDETIVPYDSRDPEGKVFDISGTELHPLLVQLAAKTKNLTFILDSCHSGTLVRGARVRSIPPDTRPLSRELAANTSATRQVGVVDTSDSPKFAAISAASSRESAFEHYSDGAEQGALTHFLVQQLRVAKAGATYRDIMDSVIGNVKANYPTQDPSLEGAEPDQYVFGDGSSVARVYITAAPSLLDPHRVTLGVGQVAGATVGSIYEVYPPGSKKFAAPERVIGSVQIISVSPISSEARQISGDKIAPASRAVERQHRFGNLRMRLFIDGNSQPLQSIRDALQTIKYIEVVDKPTLCNMQLRQSGNVIQTLGADASTLSPPVPVTDADFTDHVVSQLKSWAAWFNVLSLNNPQSGIDLAFTLKGSQTRDVMARVGRPDMGVNEGEVVEASLKNNFDRDLYVAILDLSSDGSIAVVYPSERGAKAVLQPGSTMSESFKTFISKGRTKETDILKVFASTKPIDLTPLTQGKIRSVEDVPTGELDPLQELLMASTGVSRGIAPVSSGPTSLGTWTVTQRVLVIKRAH